MYIVIAGGGSLGRSLAAQLVSGRHDVVVIDRTREVCEEISSRVGALAMHGTATDLDVLEDAGIRKADVAVGALPNDGDNLSFGLLARRFEVPRVISRMRDTRYEDAYLLAGIDKPLNMSDMFVNQLVLEIEQPTIREVVTFGRGKASIVVLGIPERARVDGMTVQDIAGLKGFPEDCVIAGIFRPQSEEFIFPRGAAKVHEGDDIFLVANSESLRKATNILHETH